MIELFESIAYDPIQDKVFCNGFVFNSVEFKEYFDKLIKKSKDEALTNTINS